MSPDQQTTLLDDLITHETQVWDALVTGDQTVDAALLSDDFLGVYSDGFAAKQDHVDQLETGPTIASYELAHCRARPLGPDHGLLSYCATFRRLSRSEDEVMYVSSIWKRHTTGWINIFSQDTPELRTPS